jgi:hypothetical protein
MDKEILLAFINSQGTGFSWIVIAFFVMITCLVMIHYLNKDSYSEGKQAARKEGLENLQASIARLVHDQQQLREQLLAPHPPPLTDYTATIEPRP